MILGAPPPPPPPPGSGSSKLERWTGLSKIIQGKFKADSTCSTGAEWPCLKLFITGKCGFSNCNACSKASQGKGDAAPRALAKATLADLEPQMTDSLKAEVKAGERARA